MILWVALVVVPLLLLLLYRAFKAQFWVLFDGDPRDEANPFRIYNRKRKNQALVTDQRERDKVIKQSFSPDKVPPSLDAIVVGSGIGGLTTAALLARAGKKVLVLEQHDQAGGCCHTFVEKGFEFDVGIHYVGEMAEGTLSRVLTDQLTGSGIEWKKLESVYDTLVIGIGEDKKWEFPIESGRGKLMASVLKSFPKEEAGIRKYFDMLKRIRKTTTIVVLLKILPQWFANLLISSGVVKWLIPELKYYQRSLADVLNELFKDEQLKAVLGYSFGDYGTLPKDGSFGMQADLTNHFKYGGFYPVGGASEIAFNIIPTIEASGGRVLVRSKVTNILMEQGKAVGVSVKQGHNMYDVMAPLVVSDAGLYNTLEMVPKEIVAKHGLGRVLKRVRHGLALFSVFIGLNGTPEEFGLKPTNIWAFTGTDVGQITEDYISTKQEDLGSTPVPLMFLSFPSTKDPTFSERYPGKTTCAIVTVSPYKWFQEWREGRVQHRGEEYEGIKTSIANQLWSQVLELYPQLEGRKVYMDVGTPLSNVHYLGTPKGEVYGLDHNVERFSLQAMADLRPEIGIPGLYLTGQDVLSCGFSGAMFGGVLCAAAVLKRNLMADLISLTKLENEQLKNKDD